MRKYLLLLILLAGCVDVSETHELMAKSAEKANSLGSYVITYERIAVNYVNKNETLYLTPTTFITKYGGMDGMRWDTVDWLNTSTRLYAIEAGYYMCSHNQTWSCEKTDASRMQEFLGYNVQNPGESIGRQVSAGALLLGEIKEEEILGRRSRCFAIEIHPEKFTQQDWNEHVLGSISRETAEEMRDLLVWQCLDVETGMKTELVLNYKTEIDGGERTVEISVKANEFTPNQEPEDSLFELP
ncbi:MAG: hypothetical protein ABIG39_01320 [Candidatus Micrarchaeota archaeon]